MAEAQQETDFTEEQLTGETVPDQAESAEKETSEEAAPPVEAKPESTPEPEKAPEATKPPKGYVPEGAMKEERRIRRELQAKLDAIEASKPPPKDPATLILEDPEAAIRLLVQQNTELREEMTRSSMEQEIRSEVPDFFDLAPKMEESLLEEGLSEESIRSIIGASGKDAPKLFKVLAKVAKNSDEKAVEERVTARITKELMAKFNIPESGVNIGRLPGSSPGNKLVVDGERGYAKLTPEQQEKWLRGEI